MVRMTPQSRRNLTAALTTSGSASSTGARAKREQAQEHLTTATTMYREMDMTYWREKAEAEMRELG